MQNFFEFFGCCGLGFTSAYFTYKFNQRLNKTQKLINSLRKQEWKVDTLVDNVLYDREKSNNSLFDQKSMAMRAEVTGEDLDDLQARKNIAIRKWKESYLNRIAIEKNYETDEALSIKVAIQGRLFNKKPFSEKTLIKKVNSSGESVKEQKNEVLVYMEKLSSTGRGQSKSTLVADLDSFYVAGGTRDRQRIKNSSYQLKKNSLPVQGLSEDMLRNLAMIERMATSQEKSLRLEQQFQGLLAVMMGKQVIMEMEFDSKLKGVLNGVDVFFLSDLVYNKLKKSLKLTNPILLSNDKLVILEKLRDAKFRNSVFYGLSGLVFGVCLFILISNWKKYKKSFLALKRRVWSFIMSKRNLDGDVINVSSLTCAHCKVNKRGVIFSPCNHMILCRDCYKKLEPETCPQCGTVIEKADFLYIT